MPPLNQNPESNSNNGIEMNNQEFQKVGEMQSEKISKGWPNNLVAPKNYDLYQDVDSGALVGMLPDDHDDKVKRRQDILNRIAQEKKEKEEKERRDAEIFEKNLEIVKEGLPGILSAMEEERKNRVPGAVKFTNPVFDEKTDNRLSYARDVVNRRYSNQPLSKDEQESNPYIKDVREQVSDLFGSTSVPIYGMYIIDSGGSTNYKRKEERLGGAEVEFSTAVFTDESIFGDKYAVLGDDGKAIYRDAVIFLMSNGARYCIRDCGMDRTYPDVRDNKPFFAGCGKSNKGRFFLNDFLFLSTESSSSSMSYGLKEFCVEEYPTMDVEKIKEEIESGDILKKLDEGAFDGIAIDMYYDQKTRCIVINNAFYPREENQPTFVNKETNKYLMEEYEKLDENQKSYLRQKYGDSGN